MIYSSLDKITNPRYHILYDDTSDSNFISNLDISLVNIC